MKELILRRGSDLILQLIRRGNQAINNRSLPRPCDDDDDDDDDGSDDDYDDDGDLLE